MPGGGMMRPKMMMPGGGMMKRKMMMPGGGMMKRMMEEGGKMDYKVAKSLMNPMMQEGGMTKDEKKEAREQRRRENESIRKDDRFKRRAARDSKAFTFGTKRKGVEGLLENLANPEKAFENQQVRRQLGRMLALGLIGGLTPNISRQIKQRGKFVPQNETSSLLERILPGLFTED